MQVISINFSSTTGKLAVGVVAVPLEIDKCGYAHHDASR